MLQRKLRFGMVGGGPGAFIGPIHRMAATLDNEAELVAGAFSSDPVKSHRSGRSLFLDSERVYGSYVEMAHSESRLPPEKRLDFVSIVTPNSTHLEIAKTFLQAGFNVICDKPMTTSLSQAKELRSVVQKSGRVFVLTHNYTGYPMVKHARVLINKGALGKVNKVVVEYPQGWLSGLMTHPSKAKSIWRLNPATAGVSCCMGDIGTHCENLLRYVTGLHVDELCADLTSFIPGNKLDDDGAVLLRFRGGARGILHASQISTGEENGLRIRVYGTKAGLEWRQEDPNYLIIKNADGTRTVLSKGNPSLSSEAQRASRLPPGHPDGFIEAFANIYREAYKAIRAQVQGKKVPRADFPTCEDGVIGLAFVESVVASSKAHGWVKMRT